MSDFNTSDLQCKRCGAVFPGGIHHDCSVWQPIETAPKNGTLLLLAFDKPIDGEPFVPWEPTRVYVGWWAGLEGGWEIASTKEGAADSEGFSFTFWQDHMTPTHWMSLPEPPKV